MKHLYTSLKLIAGAVAAAAVAVVGPSASAQTSTATSTPTTTSTAAKKPPPTSATPQMISEAIQRSKARSAKAAATGAAEQWGSEEPFTFDPTK